MHHKVPFEKKKNKKKSCEVHSIEKATVLFDTLHIDHLGLFVCSTSGNGHIILAIDGFTKFVMLRAMRNTS